MSLENVRAWFASYDLGREDVDLDVEEMREVLLERDSLHAALTMIAERRQFERADRYARAILEATATGRSERVISRTDTPSAQT